MNALKWAADPRHDNPVLKNSAWSFSSVVNLSDVSMFTFRKSVYAGPLRRASSHIDHLSLRGRVCRLTTTIRLTASRLRSARPAPLYCPRCKYLHDLGRARALPPSSPPSLLGNRTVAPSPPPPPPPFFLLPQYSHIVAKIGFESKKAVQTN